MWLNSHDPKWLNLRRPLTDVNEMNKFEYALTTLGIPPLSTIIFENDKSEINAAIHSGISTENIFSI